MRLAIAAVMRLHAGMAEPGALPAPMRRDSEGHRLAAPTRRRLAAAREGGGEAAALLRRAGCRATPQRLLVLQALGGGLHLTADDILLHARERYPSVNASTVYRTLDALAAAGLVLQTDLGGGRAHYEMAREHRHHHAVCEGCGAVEHLHEAVLHPLVDALAAIGHRLSATREITLPTLCPRCAGAPAREDVHAHP